VGDVLVVVGRYFLKHYNVSTELFTLVWVVIALEPTQYTLNGAVVKHGVQPNVLLYKIPQVKPCYLAPRWDVKLAFSHHRSIMRRLSKGRHPIHVPNACWQWLNRSINSKQHFHSRCISWTRNVRVSCSNNSLQHLRWVVSWTTVHIHVHTLGYTHVCRGTATASLSPCDKLRLPHHCCNTLNSLTVLMWQGRTYH